MRRFNSVSTFVYNKRSTSFFLGVSFRHERGVRGVADGAKSWPIVGPTNANSFVLPLLLRMRVGLESE